MIAHDGVADVVWHVWARAGASCPYEEACLFIGKAEKFTAEGEEIAARTPLPQRQKLFSSAGMTRVSWG